MSGRSEGKRTLSKNEGYCWFAFDVIDWLTSNDVLQMSMAERGVYITLLAVQWRDNKLPKDVQLLSKCTAIYQRTLSKWLATYEHLLCDCPADATHQVNAKLWDLSITVGKTKGRKIAEEKREDGEEEGDESFSARPESRAVKLGAGRCPGDPDPGCELCHGRGNSILDGSTVGCRCTGEAG